MYCGLINEESGDYVLDLIALRRQLHQHPELALHLPVTRRIVEDALAPLGLRMRISEACSSVVVVVPGSRPGPTVLLRADMDGLPVAERSGVAFASLNGNMHACGHDLHTSALVGAVHELYAGRDDFAGDVLAVFQPGEEGAGGAALMLSEDVLMTTGRRPVASFGLHVLSFAPAGMFYCREGAVMGAAIVFEFEVIGRGGHGAHPHAARDPVSTAAMIVQAIQTYVAQNSSPADPVVITVGSIQVGTAANVIPDAGIIRGSLRATSLKRAQQVCASIQLLVSHIAEAYGLSVKALIGPELGPTVSDKDGAALVEESVRRLFGPERYEELKVPEMISEDFTLFLQRTGGAFVLVGAADGAGTSRIPTNHSAEARFDDAVVPDMASLLVKLAIARLQAHENGGGP